MYWNALYMSEKREFKPCSAIEMMPWAFFFFLNSSSLLTFFGAAATAAAAGATSAAGAAAAPLVAGLPLALMLMSYLATPPWPS